jgi:hypothetical protein
VDFNILQRSGWIKLYTIIRPVTLRNIMLTAKKHLLKIICLGAIEGKNPHKNTHCVWLHAYLKLYE